MIDPNTFNANDERIVKYQNNAYTKICEFINNIPGTNLSKNDIKDTLTYISSEFNSHADEYEEFVNLTYIDIIHDTLTSGLGFGTEANTPFLDKTRLLKLIAFINERWAPDVSGTALVKEAIGN